MTKIDIFSGFLGAGKTTLIKKLIAEAYPGERLVLIENEFGDIGIDSGFLEDAGINITEMNSGCICCSLVGDFGRALQQVLTDYAPDRILIEPSGVGKLSDVIGAVKALDNPHISMGAAAAVVDVNKCRMYSKNFGEFFNNQIEAASTVILSHTTGVSDAKLAACVELIRAHNPNADILTTPWDLLSGAQIRAVLEKANTLADELEALAEETHHAHHHHHAHDHEHHHHDEHCACGHEHHHHDHDEHCACGHEHHHHDHDEHCACGHDHHHDHEHHHHDHDEHCTCGHDHHHDHGHHADEIFTSFGAETGRTYTIEAITAALKALEDERKYGLVLRAKGIVRGETDFIHFDYVPGEPDVRTGSAAPTGRLCVIGAELHEAALRELFGL